MSTPVPDVTNGDIVDASWGDAVRLAVSELQANVAPAASAVGDTSATGTNDAAANADHRHAREGFGAVAAASAGDASANGTATTVARSDHKHGLPSSVAPASSAVGDAAVTGTSTSVARADHKHARESFGGSPGASGAATGTSGVATTVARGDHQHPLTGAGVNTATVSSGAVATGATVEVTATWDAAFGGVPAYAFVSAVLNAACVAPALMVRSLTATTITIRVTNNDPSSRTFALQAFGIRT